MACPPVIQGIGGEHGIDAPAGQRVSQVRLLSMGTAFARIDRELVLYALYFAQITGTRRPASPASPSAGGDAIAQIKEVRQMVTKVGEQETRLTLGE